MPFGSRESIMKLVSAAILISTVLAGCATTAGYEAVLQTWIGDSSDHLVSVWGIPAREYQQSNGGKVMEYDRSGQYVMPGVTTYQPVTTYNNGTVSAYGSGGGYVNGTYNGTSTTYVPHTSDPTVIPLSCVTRFTADSSGRITNWAWQGNTCRATAPKQPTTASHAPSTDYTKCTDYQRRQDLCN
jgi:hypothetical protein